MSNSTPAPPPPPPSPARACRAGHQAAGVALDRHGQQFAKHKRVAGNIWAGRQADALMREPDAVYRLAVVVVEARAEQALPVPRLRGFGVLHHAGALNRRARSASARVCT